MKLLIMGSAPYMPDWIDENSWKFRENDWEVVAINHAVVMAPDFDRVWWRSEDFKTQIKLEGKVIERVAHRDCLMAPFAYQGYENGTMLVTVLFHYLNCAIEARQKDVQIGVIGCDFIYPEGQTHFYGNGGLDPLRHGHNWLLSQLDLVQFYYREFDFTLLNLSRGESLLPFNRGDL